MAARAVVRVRTRHTNGSTTVCIPKAMVPTWLRESESVEVYLTDDGGIHLLPTSERSRGGATIVTKERQIRGTYWGPNR